MIEYLQGKKTYILMAIGIVLFGAESMGIVPTGTVDKLDSLLVILGLGTIRSAIQKI
jgi:hypothetical protein